MYSQVLYTVTVSVLYVKACNVSIFSICIQHFVDKVYHTDRPTNQYELYRVDATIAQLL